MKNTKPLAIFVLSVLIALVACKKGGDNNNSEETINIGLIVPMTPSPEYSQEMIDAANLAISEINSNGGVLGKNLKLIIADDNREADQSVIKANELIDKYNVVSLSLTSSSRSLAVFNEVMKTKDVLMISPSASSVTISSLEDKNMVWRTMPSDAFQGKIAAEYAKTSLNKSEVAILHINNSYGKGLAHEFRNYFLSNGGTITVQQMYEERNSYDDFDFMQILDTLFANKPPLIYMVNNGTEAAKIASQIYIGAYFTASYHPVIMSADGTKLESLIQNSPLAVIEGLTGTSPAGAANAEFDTNFNAFTGAAPSVNETKNMYDAIYLTAYAMLAANSETPKEFITKLQDVSQSGEIIGINQFSKAKTLIEAGTDIDYDGASGKIDFDENGDVTSGTYEVWKIENGEFVTVKIIDFP